MTLTPTVNHSPPPQIDRVRHVLTRRTLSVVAIAHVTPAMLRITLAGDEIAGFVSLSPEDHVKIIFSAEADQEERRD